MKRYAFLIVFAALVAAVATTASIDAVALKRNAKVGDSNKFKLKVEMSLQGQDITYTADVVEHVLEVGSDGGMTLRQTTKNAMVRLPDNEFPTGEEEVQTVKYNSRGIILKLEVGQMDDSTYRFANILNFVWPDRPVDVGSTWGVELKANSEQKTKDISYKYSVVAREQLQGRDTFKIDYVNTEKIDGGASSKGTVWIEISSGVAVKTTGQMKNVPMAGQVIDDATYTLELNN